ncbi:MAG: ImmA/IrrE family metallo-endopeptidase [Fimbriiglobus sp.]
MDERIGRIIILTAEATKSLYGRLRDVGFTKPYLDKVAALPTWWDDSLWDDAPSRSVGLMCLSRHLGIDITTLQDPAATLRLKDFGICKYKKQAGTTDDELLLARVIATRAAQLAAAAMDQPNSPVPSAADLRAKILEQAPWVGFEQLLDFCWAAGIPVLHVNNFPKEANKKPMGFTLRVKGRPAIVLCINKKQPAWQLFILAHELGHLHHDHVPENGSILDETVHENIPDHEEEQADRYAIELLTGKADTCLETGRWPKAERLAQVARDFGRRNQIDPGHVILNCAHSEGGDFWRIANAALKLLDPNADAIGMISERMAGNLDWEKLPEESSEFLMRMTRQEMPE